MMAKNNSQSVRLTCDLKLIPTSASATTANFLNRKVFNKKFLIEEALKNFYYPEALLEENERLSKVEAYNILKVIQALESRLALYQRSYPVASLFKIISESSNISPDEISENTMETIKEIDKEYRLISTKIPLTNDEDFDDVDEDFDDDIDFGNSGI